MSDLQSGNANDLLTGFPPEFQKLLGRAAGISTKLPFSAGNDSHEVDNHINLAHVLMAWLEQFDASGASTEIIFKKSAISENLHRALKKFNDGKALHPLAQIYYGEDVNCLLSQLRERIRVGMTITTADAVEIISSSSSEIISRVLDQVNEQLSRTNSPASDVRRSLEQLAEAHRALGLNQLGSEYSLVLNS